MENGRKCLFRIFWNLKIPTYLNKAKYIFSARTIWRQGGMPRVRKLICPRDWQAWSEDWKYAVPSMFATHLGGKLSRFNGPPIAAD